MNTCPKCGSPLQSSDGYDDLFQCGTIENEGGVYPKVKCYDRVIATLKARVEALEKAGDGLSHSVKALRIILSDMGANGTIGLEAISAWLKAKGHQ